MFEAVTIRPCEWDVLHPLGGRPLAVVRLLVLRPNREPYYRAVSREPQREQRRLIGYRGSLEHAHDGVLAAAIIWSTAAAVRSRVITHRGTPLH